MIPFSIAQIEAFRLIVQLGSISAAATALGVTQPSISARLRELEGALGARLFVRQGRGMKPTPDGRALIEYADRVLGAAREAVGRFRGRDPLQGLLRFGATDSFAMAALPDLLQRLETRFPLLKTSVRIDDSGTMSEMLDEGELDIAIIADPETGPGVSREPIGANELAWIERTAKSSLPLSPTPEDMAQQHLIVNAPPSRLFRTAQAWFLAAGVAPQRMSLCNSLAVTARIAISGHALGLLPIQFVVDELAAGVVRSVPVQPALPKISFYVCYRTSEFGPGVEAIIDLARALAVEHRLVA